MEVLTPNQESNTRTYLVFTEWRTPCGQSWLIILKVALNQTVVQSLFLEYSNPVHCRTIQTKLLSSMAYIPYIHIIKTAKHTHTHIYIHAHILYMYIHTSFLCLCTLLGVYHWKTENHHEKKCSAKISVIHSLLSSVYC